MVINTDKTNVMLITYRQKRYRLQIDNLLLNSSGVNLKLSNNEKILGVQIEENLIWNGHFQYISKKIASTGPFQKYIPLQCCIINCTLVCFASAIVERLLKGLT